MPSLNATRRFQVTADDVLILVNPRPSPWPENQYSLIVDYRFNAPSRDFRDVRSIVSNKAETRQATLKPEHPSSPPRLPPRPARLSCRCPPAAGGAPLPMTPSPADAALSARIEAALGTAAPLIRRFALLAARLRLRYVDPRSSVSRPEDAPGPEP